MERVVSTTRPSIGDAGSRSLYTLDSVRQDTLDKSRRMKSFILGRVSFDRYLAAQFIFLALATGIADAVTYGTYGVFSTKQTGNAIFLALWLADHPSARNVQGMQSNIGISIGTFFLGALFFGQLGHRINQRRRGWLMSANLFQTVLIFAAAGVRYSQHELDKTPVYVNFQYDTSPEALAVIALLSFVFGGQISLAVSVRLAEINTALIDVCLIQFTMDKRLLALHNRDRDRRAGFLVAFVCGGFIGAWIIRHSRVSTALVVVGALKLVVTLSFLFNKGIVRETPIEKEEDIEANAQNWRRLLSTDCSTVRVDTANIVPVISNVTGPSSPATPVEVVGVAALTGPSTTDGADSASMLEVPKRSAQGFLTPRTQPPSVYHDVSTPRLSSISFADTQTTTTRDNTVPPPTPRSAVQLPAPIQEK